MCPIGRGSEVEIADWELKLGAHPVIVSKDHPAGMLHQFASQEPTFRA
jgi:hypothetical protein